MDPVLHGGCAHDPEHRREIIGESLLLLIGGNETTRNVISGGFEALLRYPDEKQKLIDDPGKIPAAVEECLRWVTPVINMARTATTDVPIGNVAIPEGDQVLLMYASANRDEDVFDDPGRFDVERSPNPVSPESHRAANASATLSPRSCAATTPVRAPRTSPR